MSQANTTKILETLAAEIGENVYIDVAKWHLYLSNAKLHSVVAEKMLPLLTSNSISKDKVTEILQSISVEVGGGKQKLALTELIPTQGQVNLVEILERYQSEF
ncbi:MAG: DUF3181 family protein [Cyanobacteria bacterium P01_A01_bin.84]